MMENSQIILIIVGAVIIILLIILIISKRKNKEWLIFQNTDEKNNKISYWGQHRQTGFITERFESLKKLGEHIK